MNPYALDAMAGPIDRGVWTVFGLVVIVAAVGLGAALLWDWLKGPRP